MKTLNTYMIKGQLTIKLITIMSLLISDQNMIGSFKLNVDKHVLTRSVCINSDGREAMFQNFQNNSTFLKAF